MYSPDCYDVMRSRSRGSRVSDHLGHPIAYQFACRHPRKLRLGHVGGSENLKDPPRPHRILSYLSLELVAIAAWALMLQALRSAFGLLRVFSFVM